MTYNPILISVIVDILQTMLKSSTEECKFGGDVMIHLCTTISAASSSIFFVP